MDAQMTELELRKALFVAVGMAASGEGIAADEAAISLPVCMALCVCNGNVSVHSLTAIVMLLAQYIEDVQ